MKIAINSCSMLQQLIPKSDSNPELNTPIIDHIDRDNVSLNTLRIIS